MFFLIFLWKSQLPRTGKLAYSKFLPAIVCCCLFDNNSAHYCPLMRCPNSCHKKSKNVLSRQSGGEGGHDVLMRFLQKSPFRLIESHTRYRCPLGNHTNLPHHRQFLFPSSNLLHKTHFFVVVLCEVSRVPVSNIDQFCTLCEAGTL